MPGCSKCKLTKEISAFAKNSSRTRGLNAQCKECVNSNAKYKISKQVYGRSVTGKNVTLKSRLKKFNLTVGEKLILFNSQLECCAICYRKFKDIYSACVDHNHDTGQTRGLLCKPCNTFLGIIEEDVTSLTAYLDKYRL